MQFLQSEILQGMHAVWNIDNVNSLVHVEQVVLFKHTVQLVILHDNC